MMSKYARLADHLSTIHEVDVEVVLEFSQIEDLLDAPLPHSAKADRTWWANTFRSNHATHWLNAGWIVGGVDFGEGLVRFIRPEDSTRKSKASYGKLMLFLESVPINQRQLSLTLTEISDVIGHSLPKTALRDPTWWANTRQTSPQGSAWISAGWEVEKAFLKAQVVVFRRIGTDPVRAIPRFVNSLLQNTSGSRRPSSRELCDWIRFCRRVGWCFQATVLYERGGLSIDSLSESERAEIEEDYSVSKRNLLLYKNIQTSTELPRERYGKI